MNLPRIPIALQQAVMRCLRDKLQLANHYLGTAYSKPRVNYQQRGTSAGCAHLQTWEIRLNALLLQENQQSFIDEVIPHELAHLLVFRQFGRVPPHGKEWRWVMETVLQLPANRTHSFSVESVQSKTFTYQCQCQQHALTIRRHHRVLNGKAVYYCCRCGEELQFSASPHC